MTPTTSKRIIILCRKPPYGNSLSREAIDIALAASVFDQNLAVIFSGDGIWQLTCEQQSNDINSKNHQKLLSALALYDLDEIYIDTQSAQERHMDTSKLSITARGINQQELTELLEQADVILNF